MLQVPLVETGALLNSAIHILPCVRGLHLSVVNSFMMGLKQLQLCIEFLVLSLRNKIPEIMNWHHVMHNHWQCKGNISLYHKFSAMKGSCSLQGNYTL